MPNQTVDDVAMALAVLKKRDEADQASIVAAEKEAAAWKAKEPALIKSIRARIDKALKPGHSNGAELSVRVSGEEMRLIYEYAHKGIQPPELNYAEIQNHHLMTTGKNLGPARFLPMIDDA